MIKHLKFIFIFSIIFLFAMINQIYAKGKEPEKALSASAEVRVNWNIEDGNTINKGHMTLNINGVMQLDQAHTKEVKTKEISSFFPFPIYEPQSMIVQYTYVESHIDKEPGDCPPLIAEYIGNGTFSLSNDPNSESRANLYIRKIASMMPGAEQMELLKGMEGSPGNAGFCDYYEFFAAGGATIRGKVRKSDCKYEKDEKDVNICQLAVRFKIPDDGKMKGEREWSTKTQTGSPPFTIVVSDLPPLMNQAHFKPENQPGGDVNYSVKWAFGEVDLVFLYIKRKVNGNWEDVEDNEEARNIVVGEKVELKGVVVPKDKDPKKGDWLIDGNNNKNYIKEFKVAGDNTKSELIPLKDEDLKQPTIGFYWYKGDKGKVKYTSIVDGRSYSKEAEFTIKKPEYTVDWDSREDNHFGITTGGDPTLLKKWPKENRVDPGYKGKLGEKEVIKGLEYNGILFTSESASEIPGKIQWVQLIDNQQKINTVKDWGAWSSEKGLDRVYPCARNNSFYDAPAIPTSSLGDEDENWHCKFFFDLYLMFKPKGKDNEWVPLKKINWKWFGYVYKTPDGIWATCKDCCSDGNCFLVPHNGNKPTVTDATEYPIWGKIVKK